MTPEQKQKQRVAVALRAYIDRLEELQNSLTGLSGSLESLAETINKPMPNIPRGGKRK
jgi:hypothetical protein